MSDLDDLRAELGDLREEVRAAIRRVDSLFGVIQTAASLGLGFAFYTGARHDASLRGFGLGNDLVSIVVGVVAATVAAWLLGRWYRQGL